MHYCGSGSGIQRFFDFWIRDGKKSRSGMFIPDPDISESLVTIFWVKKYLNSLLRIWIRGSDAFMIRDGINIADPQHCIFSKKGKMGLSVNILAFQ
jgi:hypothetical protein